MKRNAVPWLPTLPVNPKEDDMESLIQAVKDTVAAKTEKERKKAIAALEEALSYQVDLDEDLDDLNPEELRLRVRATRVSCMLAHERQRALQGALDEIHEEVKLMVREDVRQRLEQKVRDSVAECRPEANTE